MLTVFYWSTLDRLLCLLVNPSKVGNCEQSILSSIRFLVLETGPLLIWTSERVVRFLVDGYQILVYGTVL